MTEIVQCRSCGIELHRTALTCPKCGTQQHTGRLKNRIAAGVIALLVGGLGLHRFYLGQWWGVFYLIFCWTGIPAVVALVEGLVFLFTSQERWDEKHNGGFPSRDAGAGTAAMVVVAVVVFCFFFGVLAAIAIPAYQDYAIRGQVAQGLNLATEAKAAVAKFIVDRDDVPVDLADAGIGPAPYGENVAAVMVHDGRIDIIFSGHANRRIADDILSLTPYLARASDDSVKVLWRCGYGPVPPATTHGVTTYSPGNIAPRYLPSACRPQMQARQDSTEEDAS